MVHNRNKAILSLPPKVQGVKVIHLSDLHKAYSSCQYWNGLDFSLGHRSHSQAVNSRSRGIPLPRHHVDAGKSWMLGSVTSVFWSQSEPRRLLSIAMTRRAMALPHAGSGAVSGLAFLSRWIHAESHYCRVPPVFACT